MGGWKTVAGVRVAVARPERAGILFAGDCQGTIDPLGGQGMTMALLGAELLAPFLLKALASPSGADAPLQRDYEAAWRGRFDRRVRLCRAFHHVLVNPALLDLGSIFPAFATRLLAGCYDRTRDREVAMSDGQA
jgi:flavin-dependent dehydrogenase